MLTFQLFIIGLDWQKQKRLALSIGLTLVSGVLKRTYSFWNVMDSSLEALTPLINASYEQQSW
ncbi:hypothetical protein PILCRDRAFT_820333 [Piloderma croceum F 1598]|uniref:Uncharacterized protein n=1 Tax=Piloderma croceum (strain F 1598) TaxID=765440 RepID=A0A0C3FRT9_PILCF|nr:hypothetical protein PILCRDRAFT_820333 [Piloderma croceum F 1598]